MVLSFARYRWATLRSRIHDVNDAVKTLREGGNVKYQEHIGGAHYISVTSGYKCVDIRKFYKPDDPKEGDIKPTRTGVALRLDEWATLCLLVDTIQAAFPPLALALPCYLGDDHNNQMGYFTCSECHPFHFLELFQVSMDSTV